MRRRRFAVTLVAVTAMTVGALTAVPAIASSGTSVVTNPDTYSCSQTGYIDFEDMPDQKDLSAEAISGVQFTTTGGFTWKVGDFSTGNYNGKYPGGEYTSQGSHWAWLGEDQGSGRIDFPGGHVSYFSLLVSNSTGVFAEAYDRNGVLLESVGPATSNVGTGAMSELRIERSRADIDHVVVHDSGNYFLVDAICTDARGVAPTSYEWSLLGDSYSAGTGLGKVTKDTCDRDNGSYGVQAAATLVKQGMNLSVNNASCIGATSFDYWSAQADPNVAAAQQASITSETDIVTMTFGGNDAFLADKLSGCWLGECGPDLYGVEAGTEMDKLTWSDLGTRLRNVYVDAASRMSRSGHLYVLSYPIPFALSGSSSRCEGFTYDEQLAANAFATMLGDTIYQAVWETNIELEARGRPENVHFVEWRTGTRVSDLYKVAAGYPNADQSFDVYVGANGLCGTAGTKSFLNGWVNNAPARGDQALNSFHPNRTGYAHAESALVNAIRLNYPSAR